jgi:hypothetical protein
MEVVSRSAAENGENSLLRKKNFSGESAGATSSIATCYPPPPERYIPLRKGRHKMFDSGPAVMVESATLLAVEAILYAASN